MPSLALDSFLPKMSALVGLLYWAMVVDEWLVGGEGACYEGDASLF